MTPLERAANAIEHHFVELADPYGALSPYGMAREVARAVLQAIREPSEAMIESFAHNQELDYQETQAEARETVLHCWQAMIDAALEEG